MQKYTYGRTYVCNIKYHIIWCVKYRKKVLSEEISKDLYGILKTTAKENGFSVLEVQVGEMDHVHCFVSAPPSLSISDIVRLLKGTSARILMQNYPNLHKFLWKGHLWNPSYFVETIGSSSEENIKNILKIRKIDNPSFLEKLFRYFRKGMHIIVM